MSLAIGMDDPEFLRPVRYAYCSGCRSASNIGTSTSIADVCATRSLRHGMPKGRNFPGCFFGIRPETIEPGKPQQNGRHERMHRTLKREATQPPKANLSAQQRHFNDFRAPSTTSGPTRRSTTQLPTPSTDQLLEPTPTSSLRSSTPTTSRSGKSLQTEASGGTRVGSTSARLWATSSSGSNPSVPRCGKSTSDPLPSAGLTKELFVIFDTHGNTGRNPIC